NRGECFAMGALLFACVSHWQLGRNNATAATANYFTISEFVLPAECYRLLSEVVRVPKSFLGVSADGRRRTGQAGPEGQSPGLRPTRGTVHPGGLRNLLRAYLAARCGSRPGSGDLHARLAASAQLAHPGAV